MTTDAGQAHREGLGPGPSSTWAVVAVWCFGLAARVADSDRLRDDRGDVPGWVMIVVMTAALVAAILVPFREAIVDATQSALSSVTGLGGQ